MRMGIHVGISAWPAATMRTIARTLPATPATPATTTTVPTILCTTLLHLSVILPLSEFDSKLQLLGKSIIIATTQLEECLSYSVAFQISDLRELEEIMGNLHRCNRQSQEVLRP